MSMKTWKEEFYPVPADQVSAEDALDHSIRKWFGLTKENRERHGIMRILRLRKVFDAEDNDLEIGTCTCSLCQHYIGAGACLSCPFVKLMGKRCDSNFDGVYGEWGMNGDPEPMIFALLFLKEMQETEGEK